MGYKINPIGFRIGTYRNWNSFWYGNFDYSQLLEEDLSIQTYFKSLSHRTKTPISNCYIKRWLNSNIVVSYSKYTPPYLINKFNKHNIENSIQKITGANYVNSKQMVRISKSKVKTNSFFFTFPITNAQLVASYISYELEKRNPFKEVIQDVMDWVYETKNLLGIHIACSGRLQGEDRAKTMWKKHGKMPYSTLIEHVDYGYSVANTVYGSVGIKVWVYLN